MPYQEGLSCCLLNTRKAVDLFSSLNLNVEKVDPGIIIQGNYHLRKSSAKGHDWDLVMNTVRRCGFGGLTISLLFYKDMCKGYLKKVRFRINKHFRLGYLKRVVFKI